MREPKRPGALLLGGLLAAALLASGCVELTPAQLATLNLPPPMTPIGVTPSTATSAGVRTDPVVLNALFDLFERSNRLAPDLTNAAGTPFAELLAVGSPEGFQLRSRYLYPGIPLAEALALNPDPTLRERLVQLSRWDKSADVRTTGLIALARLKDEKDEEILHEALAHLDPAVRFGAMEALLSWGHPEKAVPLLKLASEHDAQPLLRVYASGGMAKLGSAEGVDKLRAFLDDNDWIVRAMAARFLGEYGEAKDYDLVLGHIDKEADNDFAGAEFAIAALKLFGKKPA